MRRLDYAAIRERISIRQVLELIDYHPHHMRGDQWRGLCPLCSQSSRIAKRHDHSHSSVRDFSANVRKNVFQCFRCQRSGNSLDLWAAITGSQLYQATLDLCEKLNIQPVTTKNPQPRNSA